MYADDHQIYEVGKAPALANVMSSLSRNAEKASKWYEDNMLKSNCGKYKTMAITTNPTISIQSSEIKSTEKLNVLGVATDSKKASPRD